MTAEALQRARLAASRSETAQTRANAARTARDAAIVEAARAGHSPATIAKATDLSRATVRKVLTLAAQEYVAGTFRLTLDEALPNRPKES